VKRLEPTEEVRMASRWKSRVRSFGLVAVAVITAATLAACAKTATPSSGGTTGPTTGATTASGAVSVSTASVAGVGKVLVNSGGLTLYYLKTETPGTIKCTGSCATNWPPLLLISGSTSATAGAGVKASDLGTIKRPDGGTQVTYMGMALYLFVSDQGPGQATGQSVAGFYAMPSSGPASSSGSGSGHPGY
jgi:predicted lipoprotein with Yx(FWY)xxD motif